MDTLAENSVDLLSRAADNLPSTPYTNILKSYYLTKCRTLTLSSLFNLSRRFTKATVRCPKCCVQHDSKHTMYRIKPERKQSKFARKLLKRREDGKIMTRYQERYVKNLTRKDDTMAHNTLAIVCGVCKNEVKEKLLKPKESSTDSNVSQNQTPKKKNKKRKKDRYSGLNREAVTSASNKKNKNKFSDLNNETISSLASTPDRSYNTSGFVPLDVSNRKVDGAKKNINTKKKQVPQNQTIIKIEKRKDKKMQKKNKEKKLKGLQNVLNSSKPKSSPSAALKQFLTSI